MNNYFISYDLRNPTRNYQALYQALGSLGATRVLESLWCVPHAPNSAESLFRKLRPWVDSNDGLVVTEAVASVQANVLSHPPGSVPFAA